VPITIKINGDGAPEIDMPGHSQNTDGSKLQLNPVMISPLQQQLELLKAEHGKKSPVIDKLIQGDNIGSEQIPVVDTVGANNDELTRILGIIGKLLAQ
jgi:hypothetical protein